MYFSEETVSHSKFGPNEVYQALARSRHAAGESCSHQTKGHPEGEQEAGASGWAEPPSAPSLENPFVITSTQPQSPRAPSSGCGGLGPGLGSCWNLPATIPSLHQPLLQKDAAFTAAKRGRDALQSCAGALRSMVEESWDINLGHQTFWGKGWTNSPFPWCGGSEWHGQWWRWHCQSCLEPPA